MADNAVPVQVSWDRRQWATPEEMKRIRGRIEAMQREREQLWLRKHGLSPSPSIDQVEQFLDQP